MNRLTRRSKPTSGAPLNGNIELKDYALGRDPVPPGILQGFVQADDRVLYFFNNLPQRAGIDVEQLGALKDRNLACFFEEAETNSP